MVALKSFLNNDCTLLLGKKRIDRSSFTLLMTGTLVLSLLVWSSVCEVDRVARMEGKIIPQGHSRPIQHLEGGIVSSIETSEGRFVKEGDLLLTIDATIADASLNDNKSKLKALQIKAARLKAEADQAKDIQFPVSHGYETAMQEEKMLFNSRRSKLEQDLRIHQETMRQHTASLMEAESRQKSLHSEMLIAHKRTEMLEAMAAKRAASQMELLDAQSREKRIETEIRDTENARPKLKAALAAEQARVSSLEAEFKAQAQGELVTVLSEMDRLSQATAAAEDRVKRTDVRAPITGTVNRVSITTIGAVVKPGESILEITPASEDLLLEGRVLPRDRGDLLAGATAKVRVSAYDVGKYGVLTGRLQDISADTLQDPRGEMYYRAKVIVSKIPSSYVGHPILPGMTVTADLVAGRRTIMSHLLSSFHKFSNTAFRDAR